MSVDNPRNIEKCVDYVLKSLKMQGKDRQEIYKVDYDMIRAVAFNCATMYSNLGKFVNIKSNAEHDYYIVFEELKK